MGQMLHCLCCPLEPELLQEGTTSSLRFQKFNWLEGNTVSAFGSTEELSSRCGAHCRHLGPAKRIWISVSCAWSVEIQKVQSFFLVETLSHHLSLFTILIIFGLLRDFRFLFRLYPEKVGNFIGFILLFHQLCNKKVLFELRDNVFPLLNLSLKVVIILNAHPN